MRYVLFKPDDKGATVATTAAFTKVPELRDLEALVGGHPKQIGALRSVVRGKQVQVLEREGALRLPLPATVEAAGALLVNGMLLGPIVVLGLTTGGDVRDLTDKELEGITAPGAEPGTFAFFTGNPT